MGFSKVKVFGIGLGLLITGLNFLLDAIHQKENDERTREIAKEVYDEQNTKPQEVEYTEIEDETEQTA